jgi:multidrug efflux pump
MSQFFIERPVFAWVIAILITAFGLIAIPQLPVARYPSVAPPSVTITVNYPGANAQTLNDSIIGLIEREISSVKNVLYFESSSDNSGTGTITVTFKPGTNPELAQVDVQNRLKSVEARLPQVVRQTGVHVEAAATGFLMLINVVAEKKEISASFLNEYLARNILEELKRIPGVGRAQQFGSEQAMRIWIDPSKLTSFGISLDTVTTAIQQQNLQVSPGALGSDPAVAGQRVTVPLTVEGQLTTPEQFREVILKSLENGSQIHLKDVARVELGPQSSSFSVRTNGREAATASIQLAPGANAMQTAKAVEARMKELSTAMPDGVSYEIPFNTSQFVSISIEKVIHALLEAMGLVFVVMFLFLQKIRYTLIPAIVAPIALLGTFALMLVSGYSINVLTMFGMVLAIGIIVDDAIVVVENVERIMAAEGLGPKDATRKAMKEISGAVIGITLVLSSVFVPMAFASGSVGVIYKQFTMAMVSSILFSAFLALTLTPALCATLLKPVDHHAQKTGVFGFIDRVIERSTNWYGRSVAAFLKRMGRMMGAFGVVLCLLVVGFRALPSSFLPEEDQGYFLTTIQLPADATKQRTMEAVLMLEEHLKTRPAIRDVETISGFGFSGSGSNTAMMFTMLKDWKDRHGATARDEVAQANVAASRLHEGVFNNLLPPSIDELGTSSGFAMRLEDRAGRPNAALVAAANKLIADAAKSRYLSGVYLDGLPPGASVRLEIDRSKASTLGVSFSTISDLLSAATGSTYVNDFINRGRLQQVIVQADAPARMHLNDVLRMRVRNDKGALVELSEIVKPVWTSTSLQLTRYNGYPSIRISGAAAAGQSSGKAMEEMERLVADLPTGFQLEWTGQSLQEKQSGAEAPSLLVFSMLLVFLVLAALYESWTVPMSVMLVVPLGLIGAVAAVWIRDLSNDVFFKVGMITIIGLAAKNAILIIEFANMARKEGKDVVEATIEAAKLRLRPILMTSLAFTLGVAPLAAAHGASAETQQAIGTGVFGGMISATFLALALVPVFYVVVIRTVERFQRLRGLPKAESELRA